MLCGQIAAKARKGKNLYEGQGISRDFFLHRQRSLQIQSRTSMYAHEFADFFSLPCGFLPGKVYGLFTAVSDKIWYDGKREGWR